MSKQGALVMLRGGHTSFVSKRAVSEIAHELDEYESDNPAAFYFIQDGEITPGQGNRLAVRPSDVVALVAVGSPDDPILRDSAGAEALTMLRDVTAGETVTRGPSAVRVVAGKRY
jgi:hypothetical protein